MGTHRKVHASPVTEICELLESSVRRRIRISPRFGDHVPKHLREHVPVRAKHKVVREVFPDTSEVAEKAALSRSDLIGQVDLMLVDGTDPFNKGMNGKLRDGQRGRGKDELIGGALSVEPCGRRSTVIMRDTHLGCDPRVHSNDTQDIDMKSRAVDEDVVVLEKLDTGSSAGLLGRCTYGVERGLGGGGSVRVRQRTRRGTGGRAKENWGVSGRRAHQLWQMRTE